MDTLFIPTENDFKSWIREAVKESLSVSEAQNDKLTNLDEKKVKVKGSELDYSLQIIERILQKQSLLQPKQGDENRFGQLQQREKIIDANKILAQVKTIIQT